MTVKQLIQFLEKIEDKDQMVGVSSYDFTIGYLINYAVEIKSASDDIMHPRGVSLLADI